MTVWMRAFRDEDLDSVIALNDAAFAGKAEGRIVRQLLKDGDSLRAFVAHDDRNILGHIQFFRIQVDGASVAVGLGPMCVSPEAQKRGTGSGLVRTGLLALEGAGESLVFVLGHADYYPKFGFSAEAAAAFEAPWRGPHFMARRLSGTAPSTGQLTYPAAFGGAD